MSFYFTLLSDQPFPTQSILNDLRDPDLAWLSEHDDELVFFRQGHSLRGVCVYKNDAGFEIGLNAFTTRADAHLTSQIVTAAGKILNCMVRPESSEHPIHASDVPDFCDSDWVEERYSEAKSVISLLKEDHAKGPLTIMGYRRPFAISTALFEHGEAAGLSTEQVIKGIMEEGIIVQEIDSREDIFVPKTLSKSADIKRQTSGWFRNTYVTEKENFLVFALPPNVRTLTPIFLSEGPQFVILGSREAGFRRVPYEDIAAFARSIGATEYGVGIFDLTVGSDDYDRLYRGGEPI